MKRIFFSLMTVMALAACSTGTATPEEGSLTVVATTSIIGDVARHVGGEHVNVRVLLPTGADPHSYEPRPQDIAALSNAGMVLINGLHLEETLEPLLENAQAVVVVSDGIQGLPFEGNHEQEDEHEGEEGGLDPHVWQDPNNVMVWTRNIANAFSMADPEHADEYLSNAEAYIHELAALDAWIREQVAQVPEANRKLVTDHTAFGYFAARYGFEQVGAILPSLSSGSSPSAQELAALEDEIRSKGVKAVFIGNTVSPDLGRRVADDTGTSLVMLYTGSLGETGSGAETYLEFMRYNVNAIVEALK